MTSINKDNNKQYRLSIIDAQSHKHLWNLKFRKHSLIWGLSALSTLIVLLIFCLISFTPIKHLVPGYPSHKSQMLAIQNQIKIDSLENEINKWSYYYLNFQNALNNTSTVDFDSLILAKESLNLSKEELKYLSKQDSTLIHEVDQEEKFSISRKQNRNLSLEGKHFFRPLQGLISKEFIEKAHPYIEITAPSGAMVMSCLEGTIINIDWTQEYSYSIIIQHSDNIISTYRNLDKVIKEVGEKVNAGSPIAFMGAENSTALHFELWYKGKVINPAKFI